MSACSAALHFMLQHPPHSCCKGRFRYINKNTHIHVIMLLYTAVPKNIWKFGFHHLLHAGIIFSKFFTVWDNMHVPQSCMYLIYPVGKQGPPQTLPALMDSHAHKQAYVGKDWARISATIYPGYVRNVHKLDYYSIEETYFRFCIFTLSRNSLSRFNLQLCPKYYWNIIL